MSKAFDMVNHHMLFEKLVKLKFPRMLVKLLIFWYSTQMVNVRWKSTVSSSFLMRNGTRQGSILSPYLFSVYMRDISSALNQSGLAAMLVAHLAILLCYFLCWRYGDTCSFVGKFAEVTELGNLAAHVVHGIDMKFNASKSVAMIFVPVNRNRKMTCIFDNFVLGNDNLQFVNSFKYLGHTLTDDLRDDDDMLKQMGQLYGRTNMLIRRFAKCSVPVKLRLFKAYCISFYGMALWKDYRKLTYLKIEAA